MLLILFVAVFFCYLINPNLVNKKSFLKEKKTPFVTTTILYITAFLKL